MPDRKMDAAVALMALDDAELVDVLAWVAERRGIQTAAIAAPVPREPGTLAELLVEFSAHTDPEHALLAAYWLTIARGAKTFQSADLNVQLRGLTGGIQNITDAVSSNQRRGLIEQVDKSGDSQQGRKTFRLTEAGVRAVRSRLQLK